MSAELVGLATQVATTAAQTLRAEAGRHGGTNKSSASDWVTDVDKAVEERLVADLLAARPDDSVLGEEGGAVSGTSGVRWILDPIDGTTNFMLDHPGYSVSIAAEVDGRVEVGVVCDARLDELFVATLGGGATRNGTPIGVRAVTALEHAVIATGFSYLADRRTRQLAALADVLARAGDIRRMGSAAIDLCSVACGRVHAYFEHGLNVWDYAAGALIAAEAGANVRLPDPDDPADLLVLASTPDIDAALRTILDAHHV